MLRSLVFTCTFFLLQFATAQYGNEWIEHSKTYYAFKIATEGVYQIDSTVLVDAGIPLASIDPTTIQIFNRGKQIPIHVEGEQDGSFDGADYIEFFANGAKGTDELELWEDPSKLASPHYSSINDSIKYFLSWDLVNTTPLRFAQRDSTDFNGYTESEYYWHNAIAQFSSTYQVGRRNGDGASSSLMVEGEGWYDNPFQATTQDVTRSRNVATTRNYDAPGTPDAQVKVVWVGANNSGGSQIDHHSRLSYNAGAVVVCDTTFSGYKRIEKNFTIPAADLGNSSTNFRLQAIHDLPLLQSNPTYPDKQTLAFIEIYYPHQWHMGNLPKAWIDLPDDPTGDDVLVRIVNVGVPRFLVLGMQNYRINPVNQGGWKARIPNATGSDTSHIYYFNTASIQNVASLEPVNGSGSFTDFSQLEEDSALVIVTHESLMNGAMQYAAHRNASWNEYNTVIFNVEELYDQFGLGIPKHPMGIRKMVEYVSNEWTFPPRAMFLIGKSVTAAQFNNNEPGYRKNAGAYAQTLVPSFGYPPSDPAFAYGVLADTTDLAFPVGRISAKNDGEVMDYLSKVQSFESHTTPEPWMKNIMHFVGGTSLTEQAQLSSFMTNYENIAVDTCFGGNVHTFKKTSGTVIQQTSSDTIRNLIEDGVTLMTFFAHASGSGFDISIDNPVNYNWNGKFPMLIGNSCYTGNIHLASGVSTSEQFVLPSDYGAIAFLASVDLGYVDLLGDYSNRFYESFSRDNYGGSIGDHIESASEHQLANVTERKLNNVFTFTLMGDPTLILNSFPSPEFSVETDDVVFDPVDISVDVDSFEVNVRVVNSGKATDEDVRVTLERSVNGGAALQPIQEVFLDELYFDNTATFTVPTFEQNVGEGTNVFTAKVDLNPDLIEEQSDETFNNQAQRTTFITSTNLLPIYPYEFSIVPQSGPMLKASTGDPFAPAANYYIEIDTTDLFNSPMLETTTINQVGGVVQWQPQSIYSLDQFQDSTVYFWRCAADSVGNGGLGYLWKESSFQFIPNREGWSQAQYFQFENNDFNSLVYDRPDRDFEFTTSGVPISVTVYGNSSGAQNNITEWKIDGALAEYNGCGSTPALHVGVVDPNTFEAWGTNASGQNPNNSFGNVNDGSACRSRVENYFIFRGNNQAQLQSFEDMVLNQVPDSFYVVIYSWRYLNRFVSDTIYPGALNAIEALGGNNVRLVPDSVPYILITKKGNPSFAVEEWGANINALISTSVVAPAVGNVGAMQGPLAGPATMWDALYFDEKPSSSEDSVSIEVYGVLPNGTEVLEHTVLGSVDSVPNLESFVDASIYPRVRLRSFFVDSNVVAKPSQLRRWQLISSPVPECAIDPNLFFFEKLDSLSAGQIGQVSVAINNVSTRDMDSLLISAYVVKNNGQTQLVHYERHAPLVAGGLLTDTLSFSLLGLEGLNTLIIEANPIDTLTGVFDQLEQYHFNNLAQIEFNIIVDDENPILDVTFDGLHILNGDIVSARPEILIQLDDENESLLLNTLADTSNFNVFLYTPDGNSRTVYFKDGLGVDIMQWIPADGPENISQILYSPEFEADGTYRLVVQASDLSNNPSGDNDYDVEFEVVNNATITDVVNYPNPFTTSTRFVFTLTGASPPDHMQIQIMTISGRVVREIGMDELGQIRVGKNLTDFAWDGRDQFGDKLARGVYLYRITAKLNGEDIEYRETSASPYFKKGIGKMYLLH